MAMATAAAAGVTAAAMVGKAGKAECEVCADVETAEQMHNTPSTSRQVWPSSFLHLFVIFTLTGAPLPNTGSARLP